MRSSWRGLELEFSVGGLDSGPGLRADFCIEEVELVGVDFAEFRANFPDPKVSPGDVFASHEQEIDDYLYEEVASGTYAE